MAIFTVRGPSSFQVYINIYCFRGIINNHIMWILVLNVIFWECRTYFIVLTSAWWSNLLVGYTWIINDFEHRLFILSFLLEYHVSHGDPGYNKSSVPIKRRLNGAIFWMRPCIQRLRFITGLTWVIPLPIQVQ